MIRRRLLCFLCASARPCSTCSPPNSFAHREHVHVTCIFKAFWSGCFKTLAEVRRVANPRVRSNSPESFAFRASKQTGEPQGSPFFVLINLISSARIGESPATGQIAATAQRRLPRPPMFADDRLQRSPVLRSVPPPTATRTYVARIAHAAPRRTQPAGSKPS